MTNKQPEKDITKKEIRESAIAQNAVTVSPDILKFLEETKEGALETLDEIEGKEIEMTEKKAERLIDKIIRVINGSDVPYGSSLLKQGAKVLKETNDLNSKIICSKKQLKEHMVTSYIGLYRPEKDDEVIKHHTYLLNLAAMKGFVELYKLIIKHPLINLIQKDSFGKNVWDYIQKHGKDGQKTFNRNFKANSQMEEMEKLFIDTIYKKHGIRYMKGPDGNLIEV